MNKPAKIKCLIDDTEHHYLPPYLAEAHCMTEGEYLEQHPGAPLASQAVLDAHASAMGQKKRQHPPGVTDLYLDFAGFRIPVNHDVPEEACLPIPPHYRLPKKGKLGEDVLRALRYYVSGRSLWAYGPPGTGKDALPSALCGMTRTPSAIYQISPDVDIQNWFFEKAFDAKSTKWVEGELLKQLRDGYVTTTGRRIPYTIVLSDFDRAGRSQAETIRLVTDSIQGRIKGPNGQTYKVFPGTRIVITANTMGGGDPTGKMISANVLDSSILNRIERKVRFHPMSWADERPIVEAKFPLFTEKMSDWMNVIGKCTKALRKAIEDGDLYGEFSHRDLCTWIGDCEDIIRITGTVPMDLLKQGFLSYADGLPDEENSKAALALINPHVEGGALEQGDTSHVDLEDELDF
jgi:hypothetical protein